MDGDKIIKNFEQWSSGSLRLAVFDRVPASRSNM